jgi:very-short-patch-repair endonuclease
MAAVLSCGPDAALSHDSAAALSGILPSPSRRQIHVSVPAAAHRRTAGVIVHRRELAAREVTTRHGIPVTTPTCTLVDLAHRQTQSRVEQAINKADDLGLTDPEALRVALDDMPRRRPGVKRLCTMLDRRTFRMTRSELERAFLPIARRAGLPVPLTKQYVNGFEVDFHWPELELVVETDGLAYHRTPQQQARDRLRDQAHAAAGLQYPRFTHDQVAHDPDHVERILSAVAGRLIGRISHSRDNSVAVP